MLKKNIIIDFDSTFIQVEAFDELATISLSDNPDKEQIIAQIVDITQKGMEGRLALNESLTTRIKLLQANKKHLPQLINRLNSKISTSIERNANFFRQFADDIYIISSGFKEYILPVVSKFGIKEHHILANTFEYDNNGNIIGLDTNNPLSQNQGKVAVVKNLNLKGDIVVIGDGYTDYEIRQMGVAHTFYAFTENVERPNVMEKADSIIPSFDEFLYQNDFPMVISYPKNRIKILLLENIHPHAYKLLKSEGYSVESLKGSLNEDELCEKIKDVTILGVRSKTTISKKVLHNAERLVAIGAFCIGTNQIDLRAAR